MSTYETRVALCPFCGHTLDRASKAIGDEGQPEEGDITVCSECTGVLLFTNDKGDLRKPTVEEQLEIDRDPGIKRLRHFIRLVSRKDKQ